MISGNFLYYFPSTDLGIENIVMNDTSPVLGSRVTANHIYGYGKLDRG